MKNKKALICIIALVAIAAIVVGVLFATGVFGKKKEEATGPITLTVFRGDLGDQPTVDNKIYKKIIRTMSDFGILILSWKENSKE